VSKGKLYHCPYAGCNQTSTRLWNMQIHINRKHSMSHSKLAPRVRRQSFPNGEQNIFSRSHQGIETSNQHVYEPYYSVNSSSTEVKNPETILDKGLENLRKIIEAGRLMEELTRNPVAESISNHVAKLLLGQMASNSFQGKRSIPSKKETLPTGYRISFCDTCLLGSKLIPVFYPIEVEGITKPDHKCNPKNPFVAKNEEEIEEKKHQLKVLLRDMLLDVVKSRIGQRDAYLNAVILSQHAFSEEVRRKLKLPANRHLIEEKDCIKINSSCDKESRDHWFCRAIRECAKVNINRIKITQNELTEFLSITRSTFGVFRVDSCDSMRTQHLLIYLVL
jgi:hypothetical protein